MSDDKSPLEDEIKEAAAGPQSASGDGQTVTDRSLSELIEAEKYLLAKQAGKKTGKNIGIGFSRFRRPGTQ